MPINGVPVPFHVSSIRSAQLQQQGDGAAVLRVNLNAPGGGGLQPGTYDKKLTFLREISYRAMDVMNLQVAGARVARMYVCMYVCMYVFIYVCVCVCVCGGFHDSFVS